MRRSPNYLFTVDTTDMDYALRLAQARSFAFISRRGLRVRGRLGKGNPHRDLYAVGGPLHRFTSQDIKLEYATRVDVYLK